MQNDSISSGLLCLDDALGTNGFPKRKLIEIYGAESSGKTTLCLQVAKEVQKNNGNIAIIDAENSMDYMYINSIGLNSDKLLMINPENGEQALEICEILIKNNIVNLIIVDSVVALVPKKEIENDLNDNNNLLLSKMLNQRIGRLEALANSSNLSILFTNQIRERFGQSNTTPGGKSLKIHSAVRIEMKKKEKLEYEDEYLGNRIELKIIKNKTGKKFDNIFLDIIFGRGISVYGDILDFGIKNNIIKQNGNWFYYENQIIGQGRYNAKKYLKKHKNIFNKIKEFKSE